MKNNNNNLPDVYNDWKKCYFCKQDFQEKNNIGQLKCRIHPGIKLHNTKFNCFYYSCCGTKIDQNNFIYFNRSPVHLNIHDAIGCFPIDHFDLNYLKEKGIDNGLNQFDLKKRINDLKEISVIIIPDLLFNKGIRYPLNECVLYKSLNENLNQFKKLNTNIFQNDNKFIRNFNIEINYFATKSFKFYDNNDNNIKTYNGNLIYYSNTEKENNYEIDLIEISNLINENYTEKYCNEDDNIKDIWNLNIKKESDNSNYCEDLIKNNNIINFTIVKRIGNYLYYDFNGFKS